MSIVELSTIFPFSPDPPGGDLVILAFGSICCGFRSFSPQVPAFTYHSHRENFPPLRRDQTSPVGRRVAADNSGLRCRGSVPPLASLFEGKRSAVAVVNDSPVDCQSRDRAARRRWLAVRRDGGSVLQSLRHSPSQPIRLTAPSGRGPSLASLFEGGGSPEG